MRAAAYLSHALALRHNDPIISPTTCAQTSTHTVTVQIRSAELPSPPVVSSAPDNAKCSANKGTPGSVYICGAPNDCEYWDYAKAKDCQVLGATFQHPSLVGPDFGGHCHLYSATTCADADEIKLIDNIASAPLPVPSKPGKITCPGILKENIPSPGAKALKCVTSLEHPSAPGGNPPAGPAPAPAAPTPPPQSLPPAASSTCPPPPSLPLLDTLPTPDPCKCNAATGHPGAVFLCKSGAKTPASDCKWIEYPLVKECQPLNALAGMDFTNASFVGPDFGGHCHLYTSLSCDDASEAPLFLDEKGKAAKKFVCPGVSLPVANENGKLLELWTAKAIKCVDAMAHPAAGPGVSGAGAVVAATVTTAAVGTAKTG